MDRKLGINNHCLPDLSGTAEELKLIKAAGFDMFFSGSFEEDKVYMQKNEGEKIGLSLDFLHAPFSGINNFWREDLEYLPLRNKIRQSIDSAAKCGIPTVVMHVSSGWNPPPLSDIGFAHFDDVVEYALDRNVNIAFENIRKVGNIAAIMERYERIPNVGFCYDCGHEHCYTETVHFLDIYGGRTLCTHLHDNVGRDQNDRRKDTDYHMMPFDGDIDYADMMMRLNRYNYKGALTLEISKKEPYLEKSNEEFLAIAFERLTKLSKM